MQISVRSYLTTGMTAVVGASAIVMAPALPSTSLRGVELPAQAVAEIALAGTSLPLDQIWNLLQTVGTAGSLNGIVNLVFSAVGTEFATQAFPLVTSAVTEVATYLGAALGDVLASGGLQVDFPGILKGVGTALGAGDFPGALQTLTGGLSAPITHIVQAVFGPGLQVFLTNKVGTVLGALPEILRSAVQKVLGLDIKPVTDAIAKILSGLVPSVPPAASVPVALAAAAAPTIVSTVPSIRPSEPAMKVPVVVAAAPSAPGSAAAVSPDVADEATPAAPKQSAVELADQSEPVAVPTAPRVVHRGAAESAGDAGPAVAKPAAGHRGASDAPSAAAARTGH